MTVWKLDIPITGSMTVEIHAETEEDARALLAGEYEPDVELCIQCSGYASHSNGYPVRFSLDLDQADELKFGKFKKED